MTMPTCCTSSSFGLKKGLDKVRWNIPASFGLSLLFTMIGVRNKCNHPTFVRRWDNCWYLLAFPFPFLKLVILQKGKLVSSKYQTNLRNKDMTVKGTTEKRTFLGLCKTRLDERSLMSSAALDTPIPPLGSYSGAQGELPSAYEGFLFWSIQVSF